MTEPVQETVDTFLLGALPMSFLSVRHSTNPQHNIRSFFSSCVNNAGNPLNP